MKKLLLLNALILFTNAAICQQYWQQKTDYKITVSLNDVDNTITGFEQINYHNNSPDTLNFIWIHLWPNAYKNDRTAFSDQLLQNGRTDFYFSPENRKGYINRLSFKTDSVNAVTEDHPQHQDIVKLLLTRPLAPGSMVKIETPFHVKLPYNFSRGGHIDQSYQLTQWYPKPAVYDKTGWHEMPYLDQGEFYSEFGSFDVKITVPENYVVAATGNLQNENEKLWLQQKSQEVTPLPVAKKETQTLSKKITVTPAPLSSSTTKTLHYIQENVHDFAWFADKTFLVKSDTMLLASGKMINVVSFILPANAALWKNSISFIKNAVATKNKWLGEYPYDVVTVVDNPSPIGGGMEYPTITLLTAGGSEKNLESVINHEVGHNWLYGILATNERKYPWMDEGMNTFYDKRYDKEASLWGQNNINIENGFIKNRMPDYFEEVLLNTFIKFKKDQPINTTSEDFSALNYGLIAYEKTGLWLQKMETFLGRETFDKVMQAYYSKWKFRHPSPLDFRATAEEVSGKSLHDYFNLLEKKGSLTTPVKRQIKFTPFFSLKETDKYSYVSILPIVGFNYYDKFMFGTLVHNYNLPPTNFQFFAAPLYAIGTNKLNGIGRLEYNVPPGEKGNRIGFSLSGAKFTGGSFKDSTGNENPLGFSKVVPSVKYTFANESPKSTVKKFIQFKSFLIEETNILFKRDNINNIDVITYPTEKRYVNQLQFSIENNRALYPYNGVIQAEQGDGFVRLNITGNYFFNYAEKGGLNVRIFAGKFIYTGDKSFTNQFKTDRYHLNMTGPKGYEDYNYSNYFVGRNEFEGFSSQQIMNRDGFFKVRTDLLSNKIGRSDDWLASVNLTSSIPKNINPLELLPFKMPVKLFADFGTSAEAWKKNSETGRFLYDGGVQLSLFKDILNIYFPLLYSKVYSDYFKSTITEKMFQKNIVFNIDLQQLSVSKLFSMPSL